MKRFFLITILSLILLGACGKEESKNAASTLYGAWEWTSPAGNGDMIRFILNEDGAYTMLVQSGGDGKTLREENRGSYRFDHKSIIFSSEGKPPEQMDYLFLRRDEMEVTNALGEKFFFKRKPEPIQSGTD